MRYCRECGQIRDDLWAFCESCGVETDHIGDIDEEQAQLFEFSDVDKVRSVNQQLKAAYTAAVEAVAKAETRLRKAHEELDASGRVWLQFWQLANSGGERPAVAVEAEEGKPAVTVAIGLCGRAVTAATIEEMCDKSGCSRSECEYHRDYVQNATRSDADITGDLVGDDGDKDEMVGICGMSPADQPGCGSCNSVICPVKNAEINTAWSDDLFEELAGDDDE